MPEPEPPHYAAFCAYLKMTLDSRQIGGVVNLCTHVIRDGSGCVGPFLDDHETTCQLWEVKPGTRPAPLGEHRPSLSRVYAAQERRPRGE